MQAASRYRNVIGEVHKEKFEDAKACDLTTEGSLIDVNANFVALSWNTTGGGCVSIFDSNAPHRLSQTRPMIKGHTGPVCDVKFSPFRNDLLATASDDATVRLWDIPKEGLTKDIETELQKFTLHCKKVNFLAFHPGASEIIASAGLDCDIYAWNILNAQSYCKFHIGDIPSCLNWNYNGSLLGTATKEKLAYILDPRTEKVVMHGKGHESSKIQKMQFLDENYFFTCGFSKSNERQLKLFDMRNASEGICEAKSQNIIDRQSGVIMPFYDADLGLIYLPGRGEGNLNIYEFANGGLKYCSDYKSGVPQKGLAWFEKRSMDYNRCEISRFAKLTTNSIEYISFYVPRRNEGYDASFYPDCFTGEASVTADEWVSGVNKDPVRKPITTLENKWLTTEMTFEKKTETKEEKKDNGDRVAELEAEVQKMKEENKQLNTKIEDNQKTIENLSFVIASLEAEIASLISK